MRSASSAEHSGTAPAADMMDHQHVDADGTGHDGIGAPGRVCCKKHVVLIPHWIKPTDRETYGMMAVGIL